MYNIYLSEVSEYAPKILREIEGNIEILRNNYTDKNARTKLVLLLRKFTKIDRVNIFYQFVRDIRIDTRPSTRLAVTVTSHLKFMESVVAYSIFEDNNKNI